MIGPSRYAAHHPDAADSCIYFKVRAPPIRIALARAPWSASDCLPVAAVTMYAVGTLQSVILQRNLTTPWARKGWLQSRDAPSNLQDEIVTLGVRPRPGVRPGLGGVGPLGGPTPRCSGKECRILVYKSEFLTLKMYQGFRTKTTLYFQCFFIDECECFLHL